MSDLKEELTMREQFLAKLAEEKAKAVSRAPEGTLRANLHGKSVQFYRRTKETGNNGKYLKVRESPIVRALAQKEYDRKILQSALREQELLAPLKVFYEFEMQAEAQYERISNLKRKEITPISLPPEEYAARWAAEPFTPLKMQENTQCFFSERGEAMRSKAEVIIANMLFGRGIPYRYESPLRLGGEIVFPDFTILNVRRKKELFWEHMGLMDMEDYREKNLRKITRYEMSGYFPGESLILTFETAKQPLNLKLAEKMIEKYCL